MICGQAPRGRSWPMPSIARAARPGSPSPWRGRPDGRTSGSASPWIDQRRARDRAQLRRAVARGDDRRELATRARAGCGRGRSCGRRTRAGRPRRGRSPASRSTLNIFTTWSMYLSRSAGGAPSSDAVGRELRLAGPAGAGVGHDRDSEITRSGCVAAIVWAIIPPIEAPTTWARSMLQVVEQPDGVGGHVLERVAAAFLSRRRAATASEREGGRVASIGRRRGCRSG